ncbi:MULTISPECIES: rhamnan synthesis F family protein [unclassified Cryobacterium]|uniref:rhamnan synthesis F family protein n=1 Tax=unclassified Cryobacterium TaxID=2649013 RepID=UPI002AB42CB8|nr:MULTISPECIES: rhamnan synthesis F family protein [unclassified Cryobacterium]MDY7542781.1 rhamnan synthesis F family protein [Cryobacterium sp. 5B3]MEB0264846.1 rhamnan synthesis F family protein [Cryobacterium sp. 10I5]MEB0273989.1 rhamnan synthesis F family protein [Cryobacterium sp. 5B3]
MPSVRIERGSAKLPETERVAIIASYGPDDSVSRSLPTLTAEFERNGYTVIIVRASEDDRPLRWPDAPSTNPTIVGRSNIGYDFGSWAVGLALFPAIRTKPFVILANDSLVGPFASLTPLIESFEASTSDVWGATNTTQFFAHIQSFFVGYRSGILSDPALRQFWSELEIETDKRMIIQRYELGLSQLLFAEGLTTSACFESERTVMAGQNPTMHGWKNLIQCGFPFVKRELLTNPAVVPDGNTVPAVVQNHFGVDPRDWL